MRYRRISVYQERVDSTGRIGAAETRPTTTALSWEFFTRLDRSLTDARALRGVRGRSAPRTPRSDRARMSGARCRICVAQAGWSALTTSVTPSTRTGRTCAATVGPTMSSQRPNTAPTTSARSGSEVAGDLAQRVADAHGPPARTAAPVATRYPAPLVHTRADGREDELAERPEASRTGHGARARRARSVCRRSPQRSRPPPRPPGRAARPAGGRPPWSSSTWPGGSSSHQGGGSVGVELGEHVVEEQDGRLGQVAPAQLVGGQAQGQGHAALLALRGVGARRAGPDGELEVVAMGPHRGDLAAHVVGAGRARAPRSGLRPTTAGSAWSRGRPPPPGVS